MTHLQQQQKLTHIILLSQQAICTKNKKRLKLATTTTTTKLLTTTITITNYSLIASLLLCTTLSLLLSNAFGYNLDAQKALVKTGPKNSYFGYSVAQHATFDPQNPQQTFKATLIVGAPKAETSQLLGVSKPGAVFKCDLSSSCQQIEIDSLLSSQALALQASNQQSSRSLSQFGQLWASQMTPTIQRDNQWLGVSVKSQGINGLAVACAHRYVLSGPDYRWGQGICYSLTSNLTLHKPWQPCLNRPVNRAHEDYGFCQAGISSDISESSDIVIGSPGPYTWRGSVFTNSINFNAKDDKTWYMAPVTDKLAKVPLYSYLGMSVIAGKFFNNKQQSYISGAIRANGTGQVLFMTKPTVSLLSRADSNFKTELILNGEQYASAFGYALAKLDFNGDGHQDLAVSAPFYFETNAGGAVYLYTNDVGKSVSQSGKLVGNLNSRFGFALTSVGDLNKDKCDDLAVGAPYDPNGGSVYIYLGSPAGLKTSPSQVIKASELSTNLQTFGYSLSGGLDMDQNGYPDLAVGSYADDSAFLLRARPIVEIITKIEGNLTKIDANKTRCDNEASALPCFKFNTCFEIDPAAIGEYSDSMKLKYRIEAETFNGQKFTRVQFADSEQSSDAPNVVEKEIIIDDYYRGLRVRRCQPQRVYINDLSDILTPIDFKLTYTLVSPSSTSSSNSLSSSSSSSSLRYSASSQVGSLASAKLFQSSSLSSPAVNSQSQDLPPMFPILNQEEAQKIFSARFLKDCGANDVCESNLDVDGSLQLPRETLAIGEIGYSTDKQINVTIRVGNSQEPAYDADLYIKHPSTISYSGFKSLKQVSVVECASVDKTLVKCELGNPMTRGTTKLLMIFNTHNQAGNFDFNLAVNTTSQNSKDAKTSFDLSGTIKKRAEINVKPKLTPTVLLPPQSQEPALWLLLLVILLCILLLSALFWCLYVNGIFERSKAPYRPADTEDRIN